MDDGRFAPIVDDRRQTTDDRRQTTDDGRPPLLYHGSSQRVEQLVPSQAYDGLSEVGTASGVFATSLYELALVFALGCVPDAQGRVTRLVQSLDPIRVIFLEGGPKRGGSGYIYTLSSATFQQLDQHQWLSAVAVTPISVAEIRVDDYIDRVQAVSEEDRARLLAAFQH